MIFLLGLFAFVFAMMCISQSIISDSASERARETRDAIWKVTPGSVERVDSWSYRLEVKFGRTARFVVGFPTNFRFADTADQCSQELTAECTAAVKDFLGSHT